MINFTKFILFLITVFVFNACHNLQPPTSPSATATIKGQVVLVTGVYPYFSATPAYGGIHVSLDGTSFSTMTNDSGLYEFDAVPEGTYDVRFSKPGYGDVRWFGMTVQGGGKAPIYWYDPRPWNTAYSALSLIGISDLVTTAQSVSLKDTIPPFGGNRSHVSLWLSGHYSGVQPGYDHAIAVYFSHHSDVSSAPGHYEYFEPWWGINAWSNSVGSASPFDTLIRSFAIPIDYGWYQRNGFHSGDSVYIATYGGTYWSKGQDGAYDYYDPTIRQGVLTSINQTPSPVVGFKIP